MPRPLPGAVVVITGASSGIGRASARRFAERGARLVLAARHQAPLASVATECEQRGAEVATVVADVADEVAVAALARTAVQRFGGIDVWVNNAGVIAYGTFEQTPPEVFRRVIETNLLGQVHGARAALPEFRRGDGGVLINVSSVWGRITSPHVAAYVASKHAVRAFSECLRHELDGTREIEVATILPEAVDTPIFHQAANHTGRGIRPVPPVFDPDEVAQGIVACAQSPKREVTYGRAGRLLELMYRLTPRLYCRISPRMFDRGSFTDRTAPPTDGNVLAPRPEGHAVYGGWRSRHRRTLLNAGVAAAAGAAAAAMGRRRA